MYTIKIKNIYTREYEVEKLEKEIANLVSVVSDRHKRAVKYLKMSKSTYQGLSKTNRIFKEYYVYVKGRDAFNYRSNQSLIQHIPIRVCETFEDGQVEMDW